MMRAKTVLVMVVDPTAPAADENIPAVGGRCGEEGGVVACVAEGLGERRGGSWAGRIRWRCRTGSAAAIQSKYEGDNQSAARHRTRAHLVLSPSRRPIGPRSVNG